MAKRPEEIRRFWAQLDMPLEAAWHRLNTRSDGATYSTIEALMLSLRRGLIGLRRDRREAVFLFILKRMQ